MATATDRPPFEWIGGRLCLDFTNTVSWAGADRPSERLRTYDDLLAWAREAQVLTPAAATRLGRAARETPDQAKAVLGEAHRLREAIHQVFAARAAGREPSVEAATLVNRALARALGRLRLELGGGPCSWTFAADGDELDRMLWPVAWSAANLLTSDDVRLARMCASDRCGWLFLDRSRNRSRRWCDMKVCGNTAKARRFYARARRRRASRAPSGRQG